MKDILFYDGNCSLCAGEIRMLKQLKDESLDLSNIHDAQTQKLMDGKVPTDLLAILHLKQGNGEWQTGLDAMVTAWGHTPIGWILRPLRWPLIKTAADWCYYRWADKRACRLGYSDQCQIKTTR